MADGGKDADGYNRLARKQEMLEKLATLPGHDPAIEVANSNWATIPADGWLVLARVLPEREAEVTLLRYGSGGLRMNDRDIQDMRAASGSVELPYWVHAARPFVFNYVSHERLAQRPEELLSDANGFVRVPSGRFIVNAGAPSDGGGMISSLDVRRYVHEVCGGNYDPDLNDPLPACRITDDRRELMEIMSQLGVAMGLDQPSQDDYILTVEYQLRNVR